MGDLAALLFGASSLALVIFSLLIAGLAIVGWQTLKTDVTKEIEASVSARIESLEKEMQGRVLAAFGVIQGRFYLQALPHAKTEGERVELESTLAEVVDHCWQSYTILQQTKGTGHLMALNNYLYFASMQEEQGLTSSVLDKAREFKKVAAEKRHWEGMLTYCRVVSVLSESPDEVEETVKLASDLEKNPNLSDRQKREAASYATPLRDRLELLRRRVSGSPTAN